MNTYLEFRKLQIEKEGYDDALYQRLRYCKCEDISDYFLREKAIGLSQVKEFNKAFFYQLPGIIIKHLRDANHEKKEDLSYPNLCEMLETRRENLKSH